MSVTANKEVKGNDEADILAKESIPLSLVWSHSVDPKKHMKEEILRWELN